MKNITIRPISPSLYTFIYTIIFILATSTTIFCCEEEKPSKIYLALHFAPHPPSYDDTNNCDPNESVLIYRKGIKYYAHIFSPIGDTLHIEENKLIHHALIIVTTAVETRKRRDKVVGLVIPEDASHESYQLCYAVNNDGVSYHWQIEKIEDPSCKILEDAIVIVRDPSLISIKPFDKTFMPLCPLSGKQCCGVVILPTIYIKNHSSSIVSPLTTLNIDQFHTSHRPIESK